MPKTKEAAAIEAEEEEPKPTRRRKVLIPAAVIVLALLVGGVFAGGLLNAGAADESDGGAEPSPPPAELGELVQLESVTLNLAGGRFLKLGVALELAPGQDAPPATAPVYDEVIELFGGHTFEGLSDPAVREAIKTELLARLSQVYGETFVGAYFTEFVMQ